LGVGLDFGFLGFGFGLGEKTQNPTQKPKKIGVPVTGSS